MTPKQEVSLNAMLMTILANVAQPGWLQAAAVFMAGVMWAALGVGSVLEWRNKR